MSEDAATDAASAEPSVKPGQPLPGVWIGVLAALLTVTIWGGWIVATRFAVSTKLNAIDVGLLRYGVPALLLTPVWWRVGLIPKGVPKGNLLIMVLGAGFAFMLVAATGMKFAPAGHIGSLLPGTMPLWTALIALILFGERFSKGRIVGYGLIVLGVILLGGANILFAANDAWIGHLLFLTAACMWGAYTHAFNRNRLTALEAAGIISAWSFIAHLIMAAIFGFSLFELSSGQFAVQFVFQGLLGGFIAVIGYGISIRYLGASVASSFSALVPVLAALGGLALLGESLQPFDYAAVVAITVGVALAAGLKWRRAR